MAAPRDATQPIIAHGSVFLRAPERDDIPRFVGWLNDYATSRTLGVHAPLSIPLEEQPIEGGIEIRSDDLAFVSAFSPEVEDAGGRLRIESAISGTAGLPTRSTRIASATTVPSPASVSVMTRVPLVTSTCSPR